MCRLGSPKAWAKASIVLMICCCGSLADDKYAGGSGTAQEPYEIATSADWQQLMASPIDWASHFVLIDDIDLNDVLITPIGDNANNFTGVFDGNAYVIHNADANMPDSDYVGLFGYIGTGGQIKNVGVEGFSITGRYYVGGIVGYNNYGTVGNCFSVGLVSGTYVVGGMVGWNKGTISDCYSTGFISGVPLVGGLVGQNGGTITNCYSSGSVTGSSSSVGGLVGHNYYGISNCYATGSVTGNFYVGGLVGSNGGTTSNCYSTGSVTGNSYVGGLVGHRDYKHGTVTSSFWDVNTSGWTTSAGGTGITTSQMQDINTFLEAGWDFVGDTADGTCNYWLMPEPGGYPVLSILNGYIPPEPSGSGTEEAPYIVTDANELGTIWYRPSAYYVMANDIDLAGIKWSAPIVPFFSGIFDGNDYVIRNLDVNMPDDEFVGLFGNLKSGGQIKNLGVENASVVGNAYVGVLVGYNDDGAITNSYSTGSVSGNSYVGGMCGDNHGTISDSYATGSFNGYNESYGLGGLVGSNGGTISNCYSTGSVTGYSVLGGLCGYNDGGIITNCYSTGSVSGDDSYDDSYIIGGLVGGNVGTISNCYSESPVSGDAAGFVGGLVGSNGGTISNCYATGSVRGYWIVGGLVGENDGNDGIVSNCSSTGSVSGNDSIGGLVGSNYYGTVGNCYSIGSVTGNSSVGGLVGENDSIVGNCYSTGSVTGNSSVGGLVGYNCSGTVGNCYSAGLVSGTHEVGGLVGRNEGGRIADSFWDVSTSGRTASAGGAGRTTVEMQDVYTFIQAGWDFVAETANGTCDFWIMPESGGYPALATLEGFIPSEPSGSGTPEDPYIITDANELGTVWYRPSACYVMVNDIDLAGINWSTLIVPLFSGIFDGNDHTLRNLGVNMPNDDFVGLFGYLNASGQIKNLGVENASVVGGAYVGGLVGYNDNGAITNCCSTGSVSGNDYVGGLVGRNSGSISNCYSDSSVSGTNDSSGGLVGSNYYGTVGNCYSTGSVNGNDYVGGLVGNNGGTISNCYSTGTVCGDDYIGGLVGSSGGTISNCYSAGSVTGNSHVGGLVGDKHWGTVTSSFWDVRTSGRTTSAGGAGRTTVQMQDVYTFIQAGWDFVDETANGTCDYWIMPQSRGYSTGSVACNSYVGGLVGSNGGTISNCYSTGSVIGSDDLGGLCGYNYSGTIRNCYFYLFSGPDNHLGNPLDEVELTNSAFFTGFDFAGDPDDGTDDVWTIVEGHCPKLAWQADDGPVPPDYSPSTSLSGSGHSYAPFQINSYTAFTEFMTNSSLNCGYYIIMTDIDLSGQLFDTAIVNRYFGGHLEGSNHIILNLTIGAYSGDLGLFKILAGSVSNLGIENIRITGGDHSDYLGGLCGRNSGTIINCYSIGSVAGGDYSGYLGGLCGDNHGTISNSYAIGLVAGGDPSNCIGGLCGSNQEGTISNCCATGWVSGEYKVGGLCGFNDYGTISNCYVTDSVVTADQHSGGLCGSNSGAISNCCATGWVSGDYAVGGLCGFNDYGTISNCYATGSVTGYYGPGGLCGSNSGTISNCYAAGMVTGFSKPGGLCRYNEDDEGATINNCFWDIETTEQDWSDGGTGLSTEDMHKINSFTDAGWDFIGEEANGTEDIWAICEGEDYPQLTWQYVIGDLCAFGKGA